MDRKDGRHEGLTLVTALLVGVGLVFLTESGYFTLFQTSRVLLC